MNEVLAPGQDLTLKNTSNGLEPGIPGENQEGPRDPHRPRSWSGRSGSQGKTAEQPTGSPVLLKNQRPRASQYG